MAQVEKFFVNQMKHKKDGTWVNDIIPKETEYDARHKAHLFMSTYAYEQDQNVDYCSVSVTNLYGAVIVPIEVDNRIVEQPEPEEELEDEPEEETEEEQ